MTAPAIPTREDISAAWLLCGDTFDVSRALAERTAAIEREKTSNLRRNAAVILAMSAHDAGKHDHNESRYASVCPICADADDTDYDDPELCGCDDCIRAEREATR